MIPICRTKMFMLSASFILLIGCKPPADNASKNAVIPSPEAAIPAVAPVPEAAPSAVNNPDVINFQGFGPVKFGANEASVRTAWGRPMQSHPPAEGSSCFYLNAEAKQYQQPEISFMFEAGKFVRYDVEQATLLAPGNIKVGDSAAKVMAVFDGRIENNPHKYIVSAYNLTVTPEDKSDVRLIFEIGEDGKVINWRIGVPPQVFYVEGCS